MGTVAVMCRVPGGVSLQLAERHQGERMVLMGERLAMVGDPVQIKGPRSEGAEVSGGFAVNRGVDAGFWGRWLEQNATNPHVLAGDIHAGAEPEAEAPAQE